MRATTRFWLCFLVALGFAACGGDDPAGGDAGTDGGGDGSADSDSDADTDPACSPEILDDGTGVYWLQCLAGQCWDGAACVWEGEADSLTYDEAATACPSDYRLPTIEEIMGLLGNCTIDLALDEGGTCDTCPLSAACDAIYPDIDAYDWLAPEIVHWSGTTLETSDARAWRINFQSGLIESKLKETPGGTAVCVRTE
jgi:hypothetical protein